MSNLDDNWLSTRNRARIVPKKKDVIKKRSSLPKPRKSSIGAAFPMTQNSPPPKLLRTATKQSKLNDFFKPGDIGSRKCLKENRQAVEVNPGEVSQRTNPDGSRSRKFDTSGNNVKIPGCLSGTAVYDSKASHYQGKENISKLYDDATNEYNTWRGCLHQAKKLTVMHEKYDMNSNDFETACSLQHPACKFQDTQRNDVSWLSEKHKQGVKREIPLDEINKPTVCKRHKKENTRNDTEILSKVNGDIIPSHRLQISYRVSSKATEEKTTHEKLQEESQNNQFNIATDEEIALDIAKTNKEFSGHNNVEEGGKTIEEDHETKDTASDDWATSTMYRTADVIQFEHTQVNAKMAGKLTDTMIDTDNHSSHDSASFDLSAEDHLECSQGSGLLFETQLHSEMDDDGDNVINDDDDENTELNLDNSGDSMGQSLELCTQFTLSSQ